MPAIDTVPTIWVTKVSDRLFKIQDLYTSSQEGCDALTNHHVGDIISQTDLVKLLDAFVKIEIWKDTESPYADQFKPENHKPF